MKMDWNVQSVAHAIGKDKRGRKRVLDLTPVVLMEIRDGIRGLSTRMDGLERKMDGLEQGMVRLRTEIRQDMHEMLSKHRVATDGRFELVDRRLSSLETKVEALEATLTRRH